MIFYINSLGICGGMGDMPTDIIFVGWFSFIFLENLWDILY
jgi:hypothetical protein